MSHPHDLRKNPRKSAKAADSDDHAVEGDVPPNPPAAITATSSAPQPIGAAHPPNTTHSTVTPDTVAMDMTHSPTCATGTADTLPSGLRLAHEANTLVTPPSIDSPQPDISARVAEILCMMQTMHLGLNQLTNKFDQQNDKFDQQNLELSNQNLELINKMDQQNLELSNQNKELTNKMDHQNIELTNKMAELTEINCKIESQGLEFKNDLAAFVDHNNKQFLAVKAVTDTLQSGVQSLADEQTRQRQETQNLSQRLEQQENVLADTVSQINSSIATKIGESQQTLASQIMPVLEQHTQTINLMNNRVTQNEQLMRSLTSPAPAQTQNTGPTSVIYVTPSRQADCPVPKFNGRTRNPCEFLVKLKKFYERGLDQRPTNLGEAEYTNDVIEASLEHHASHWYGLIKNDSITWESFERAFIAKYWSREIQRGVRQKLETDKYRPGGKLTRSEYFVERVLTLRSTTPPMEEDEIVTMLAGHFDELIQDARRVQNVATIADFEALLQREDIAERHRPPGPNDRRSPRPDDRHQRPNPHREPRNQRPWQDNQRRNQPWQPSRPYEQRPDQRHRPHQPRQDNFRSRSPPHRRQDDRRYPTGEQTRTCAFIAATPGPSHNRKDDRSRSPNHRRRSRSPPQPSQSPPPHSSLN